MEIYKRRASRVSSLSSPSKMMKLTNMFVYRAQSFGYPENIQQLRETKKYFDLILLSDGGVKFDVHSLVIFTQIPKLGENWLDENSPAEYNVALPEKLLKAIIDYCYIGEMNSSLNEDLLILWNFCQSVELTDVKISVETEILNILTIKNSLSFLNMLNDNKYPHETIRKKCLQLIIEGFAEIVNCHGFLNLSPKNLTDILSNDDLFVSSEEMVLEALLKWYYKKIVFALNSETNDYFPRVIGMENVLQAVRLPLIRPEITIKFRKVWENNEQTKLMYDYSISQLMNLCTCGKILKSEIKPRSATFNRVLTIRMELKDKHIYLDMLKDKRWQQIHHIQCTSNDFLIDCELAKLDNENIMLIGGRQSNRVHCLNLKSMQIRSLKPMHIKRRGLGVASINGFVYVAGGCANDFVTNLVERYNPQKDEWELIASMTQRRANFQLVATENCLYAIGGCDNENFLKSVECYDIINNSWKFEEPMLSIRRFFAATVHENFIYVLGGHTQPGEASQCVERFSLITKEWKQVASLTRGRHTLSAIVFQNQIFALGGYNSCMYKVKPVEVYDEVDDKWITVISLNAGGHLAAFVVPAYVNKLFNK